MKLKINELIDERFPDLPIYIERENIRGKSIQKSRSTWEDLRYHLLAQEIQGFASDALLIKDVASKFYSPSKPDGLEQHFITKICKSVLKNTYKGVKDAYILGVFKDIIIHSNDPKYQDFLNDVRFKLHSKDSRGRTLSRKLAREFIHESGRYSYLLRKIEVNRELSVAEMDIILKCAVYGIITPLLLDCYKARLTPELIQDRYGFFTSEKEVIDWTIEIFAMSPDGIIRFLKSGDLNVDFIDKFGVKI